MIVLGYPNFYPKFGFRPAYDFGVIAPFDVPKNAFLILELKKGVLIGVSGIVKYPPAFDEV